MIRFSAPFEIVSSFARLIVIILVIAFKMVLNQFLKDSYSFAPYSSGSDSVVVRFFLEIIKLCVILL